MAAEAEGLEGKRGMQGSRRKKRKGGGFREEGLEGEKSLLLALSLPGKKEEKGEENWKPRALGFPTGQRG